MIEGVGHISQRHIGPLAGQPVGQHPRHRPDPLGGLSRHHQACVTAGPVFTTDGGRSGPCSSTTCALVPPNPNEDTPARLGRPHRRPISRLGNDFQPQIRKRDMRIRILKTHVRRDMPPLHRQHRLAEPRNPRRGLQMTQIGLDRADQQWRGLRTSTTQHRPECAGFDGIAKQRAGSVGLHIVDVARPRCRHWRRRHATPPSARPGWGPSTRWTGRPD